MLKETMSGRSCDRCILVLFLISRHQILILFFSFFYKKSPSVSSRLINWSACSRRKHHQSRHVFQRILSCKDTLKGEKSTGAFFVSDCVRRDGDFNLCNICCHIRSWSGCLLVEKATRRWIIYTVCAINHGNSSEPASYSN